MTYHWARVTNHHYLNLKSTLGLYGKLFPVVRDGDPQCPYSTVILKIAPGQERCFTVGCVALYKKRTRPREWSPKRIRQEARRSGASLPVRRRLKRKHDEEAARE